MSTPIRTLFIALLIGGAIAYVVVHQEQKAPHSVGQSTPSVAPQMSEAPLPRIASVPPSALSPVVPYSPTCREALQLRIGQVDPEFNLDTATLENALHRAIAEWNSATGHTWFRVSDSEGVAVNLLFDGRQADIEQRKVLEQELDTEIARLKEQQHSVTEEGAKVEQLINSWKEEHARYESRVATLNAAVAEVNGTQNPDATTVDTLTREKNELSALRQRLEASATQMNSAVDQHNAKAREVQRAGELLQAKVEALRERFPAQLIKEAEHRRGAFVNEINIYTFTDAENLHFALLHELGHTIGLSHSDVPEAIMAPVRQLGASSTHLTASDITAAQALCPAP